MVTLCPGSLFFFTFIVFMIGFGSGVLTGFDAFKQGKR